MNPFILAAVASILIYIIAISLLSHHIPQGIGQYTRHMLERLRKESAAAYGEEVQEIPQASTLVRVFLALPFVHRAMPLIQRSGLWQQPDRFVLGCLSLFTVFFMLFAHDGSSGILTALGATWVVVWMYLNRRIKGYRKKFLDLFPDALDSIVRSVRAGYPLNSAIALVGDHTAAPLGPEFKRVADEAAYGWTLQEALVRLSERIGEPDVNYFAIVVNLQQESGGSLSEILSNLANVLRGRKQLRMKIRALSSEGRTTAWVLGLLPFAIFGVLYWIAPAHVQPLFDTELGHVIIGAVLTMVGLGMLVVRQIINMDM